MLSSRRRNVFPGYLPGRQELLSVLRRAAPPVVGVRHHALMTSAKQRGELPTCAAAPGR